MQATAVLLRTREAVIGRGYRPREDEPFMCAPQLEFFRRKLCDWKEDILRESRETLGHLQTETEKPSGRRRPRLVGDRQGA